MSPHAPRRSVLPVRPVALTAALLVSCGQVIGVGDLEGSRPGSGGQAADAGAAGEVSSGGSSSGGASGTHAGGTSAGHGGDASGGAAGDGSAEAGAGGEGGALPPPQSRELCPEPRWSFIYDDSEVPPNAVVGGQEEGAGQTYICLGDLEGQTVPGRWIKGQGCVAAVAGRTQSVDGFQIASSECPLAWIRPAAPGAIPVALVGEGYVPWGEEFVPAHFCRATFGRESIVGYITRRNPTTCLIGTGITPEYATEFEVLTLYKAD